MEMSQCEQIMVLKITTQLNFRERLPLLILIRSSVRIEKYIRPSCIIIY